MNCKKLLPLLALSIVVTSCGDGESNSTATIVPTEATVAIDTNNSLDLAIAATEGVKKSVNSGELPTGLDFGAARSTVSAVKPQSKAREILTCSEVGFGAGNIVVDFSNDGRVFSFTYSCVDISGRFEGSFTPDIENWTSFSGSYIDFLVQGISVDASIACNRPDTTTTVNMSCTFGFNDIAGLNGGTFSIGNVTVEGDDFTGYSITATVNDPASGAVNFSANNLTFGDCAYGVPNSGTLTLSGIDRNSITVTYNDCNSFTLIDVTGSATVYSWADLAI